VKRTLLCNMALLLSMNFVPPAVLQAQVCRLSVAGLNQARQVMGLVNVECPAPLHSALLGTGE